jgi:hypothetical protein
MAPNRAAARLPAPPRMPLRMLAVVLLAAAAVLGGTLPGIAAGPTNAGRADLAGRSRARAGWRLLPGARPGHVIGRDGIAVTAPRAGLGVTGEALMADGSERWLSVRTAWDGRVLAQDQAAATPVADPAVVAGAGLPSPVGVLPVCQDRAYNLTGSWWHDTTLAWSFRAISTPSELRVGATIRALKEGVADITGERNSCGRPDHVSATSAYLGRTSTAPNIGPPQECRGSGDGQNVVGFGDLGAGIVAFSCWWYTGTTNVEADMLLNKHDFDWTTTVAGCLDAYLVRAIATHEFGHIYGLAHVSESQHPLMTMSTAADRCDDSPSTLGLGDMLGLERHY